MLNEPKKFESHPRADRGIVRRVLCAVALVAVSSFALAAGTAQKTFDAPEAAVAAMVNAVRANDLTTLRAILGERGEKLIVSGDAVADAANRAAFIAAYDAANKIVSVHETQATLVIGKDEWPMPIPLVKADGGWRFDTQSGEREILKRRIGRNELSAIQACLAIVDAEREYVAKDQDGDGISEYARKLVSARGKRDGLYWDTQANEQPSPLGPLLAAAAKEGYALVGLSGRSPYHGYFYRILTKQGKDAPGGAYDYVVKGKMMGGFAVVAYPARYGASGIMTFIVNHDGQVYQKDLGKNTSVTAAGMTAFNPDPSWNKP